MTHELKAVSHTLATCDVELVTNHKNWSQITKNFTSPSLYYRLWSLYYVVESVLQTLKSVLCRGVCTTDFEDLYQNVHISSVHKIRTNISIIFSPSSVLRRRVHTMDFIDILKIQKDWVDRLLQTRRRRIFCDLWPIFVICDQFYIARRTSPGCVTRP